MDKKELEKWLLKQVILIKLCQKTDKFNEETRVLCFCGDRVHLDNCRKVAETLGIIYDSDENWNCEGSTAIYVSFKFHGITFYELENYKERE